MIDELKKAAPGIEFETKGICDSGFGTLRVGVPGKGIVSHNALGWGYYPVRCTGANGDIGDVMKPPTIRKTAASLVGALPDVFKRSLLAELEAAAPGAVFTEGLSDSTHLRYNIGEGVVVVCRNGGAWCYWDGRDSCGFGVGRRYPMNYGAAPTAAQLIVLMSGVFTVKVKALDPTPALRGEVSKLKVSLDQEKRRTVTLRRRKADLKVGLNGERKHVSDLQSRLTDAKRDYDGMTVSRDHFQRMVESLKSRVPESKAPEGVAGTRVWDAMTHRAGVVLPGDLDSEGRVRIYYGETLEGVQQHSWAWFEALSPNKPAQWLAPLVFSIMTALILVLVIV